MDIKQKRQANIYDAVAGNLRPLAETMPSLMGLLGRITTNGFIRETPYIARNRGTISSSSVPLFPDEVLFKRKDAPRLYGEDDIYSADQDLTDQQRLPDSDLLKAVHAYAAEFYGRATLDKGQVDIRSMDETALLGLGILLEETVKGVLGETGDMVFVEGEEVKEAGAIHGEEDIKPLQQPARSRTRSTSRAAIKSGETRRRKRRKLDHRESDDPAT